MGAASDLIPDSVLAEAPPVPAGESDDLIPPSSLDAGYTAGSDEKPSEDWATRARDALMKIPAAEFAAHEGTAIGSQLKAGAGAIYDLATGKTISEARRAADKTIAEGTYQPKGAIAKAETGAFDSGLNPLNWSGQILKGGSKALTGILLHPVAPYTEDPLNVRAPEAVQNLGVYGPPLLEGAGNIALGAYGASKAAGMGKPRVAAEPAPSAPETPPEGFDSEPVKGGLAPAGSPQAPAVSQARAAVLQRVGLDSARESALTGDAANAANDFQLTKFNEPAGVAAKAQFDAEKAALQAHVERIVEKTGGTVGMDEDTVNTRGQTIAAPFDALRQWFSDQKKSDYAAADAKAAGKPIGQMEGTQKLLEDPDFTETLLAKDQGGLLGSAQRQFKRFQELTPSGWTVETAENFRKWLNQVWTPENSATLGKLKGAVDDDVLKGAGEDVYGPARQRVVLEHTLLDDPDGVSTLFDRDPRTPINRTTPYNKIPDTLWRLPPDQFANVMKTLEQMPPEVQPLAQAAKAEIQAHGANKLLEAGSATQGQWAAPAVSKVLKGNSAKIQMAFKDSPEVLSDIRDLDSAGRILKVDQSYPGAAAQTANALKRGFMSHALSRAGTVSGAAAGSFLGPPGAAVGAAAGEYAGSRLGTGLAERNALGRWERSLIPLDQLVRPKQ